ncbi:MAG: CHAT domain-containing protein [Candidatus Promineifilaceae bacterium]|nr:CHAT domain-containing protein [Anaerolineaceae bacterium]
MIDHVAAHPILAATAVSKITTPKQLLTHLLNAANHNERRYLLAQFAPNFPQTKRNLLADLLKKEADRLMWENIDLCFEFADLLSQMAHQFDAPMFQALSLRARGNGYAIGLREHQKGIDCYDEAAAIYAALGRPIEQAWSQNGKLYALANLSRYDEALATGKQASKILADNGEWAALGDMMVNLAIIHGQLSQDVEALAKLDQAKTIYHKLGHQAEAQLLRVDLNRGILLRNLGRFNESIQALKAAQKFQQLGQSITAAQAQQNLGMTYFVMGRYNEALTLLDAARETFLNDGREKHALLTELLISECLLSLRRFNDVLAKCQTVRDKFGGQLESLLILGQAILNEAKAHAGLGQLAQAQTSVDEARDIFQKDGNPTAVADAELQTAVLLAYQGQYPQAVAKATASGTIFAAHQLPVGEARACLVAARAALHLHQHEQAQTWIDKALAIGQANLLPAIAYQGFQLEGELSQSRGQFQTALAAYEAAIDELEQLYGRLMIEFRADFLEDKERIYEETVLLCLHLKQPRRALEFCERAKSRALQDLLNLRINLNIEARSDSDKPLVARLHTLRAERDRLYRRWEVDEELGQRGDTADLLAAQQRTENKIVRLENEITDLWHKLLIRNADYARDASLWQVRAEPAQPYLPDDTILLEFFAARGKFILFLITRSGMEAIQLEVTVPAVQQTLQLLWLNLRSVPRSSARQQVHLARNAQTVLQQLYNQLLRPVAGQLASYQKWIVVPHGPLHYLPFAALHNGQQYLVETTEISMLPGSSLLRFCNEAPKHDGPLVAVGHSYNGRLPHAVSEAQQIAARWCGHAYLEEEATLAQIEPLLANGRILHLATHGDFRADNPLFSGLALADGWLTTIDIFNLKLRASLVTLSACQTGRSVIGGGDELLGLMRAFLGAGAASLIASFWAVEDQTTAWLMHQLYEKLAQGESKAAALRAAQLRFLQEPELANTFHHPYFWAPFFLVGDAGNL